LVLTLFKLLLLAGILAGHVRLGRARAAAALDAVSVATTADERAALGVAFSVAVGFARRDTLRLVCRFGAVELAPSRAFAKAVVDADDVDARVAIRTALFGALVGTGWFGIEDTLLFTHRLELGGAGLLVDADLTTASLTVQTAADFAAAGILEADVPAFGDARVGHGRERPGRKHAHPEAPSLHHPISSSSSCPGTCDPMAE